LLARKFAFFVLLPLLVLLVGGATTILLLAEKHLRRQQDKGLIAAVRALDASITARLASIGDDLQVMASHREIEEYFQFLEFGNHEAAGQRLVALEERLALVAALKPRCSAFRFLDASGRTLISIVNGQRSYRAVDLGGTRWFSRAVAATDKKGAHISSIHAMLGEPAVTLSRPVAFRGKVYGLLTVDVLVARLTRDLLPTARAASGGHVYVVSPAGRVIARDGPGAPTGDVSGRRSTQRLKSGYLGVTSARNGDHGGMRIAYAPQSDLALGLVLGLPDREAFAPVRRLRDSILVVTLIAFLVVAGAGFWLVRRTVRPVRLLTRGAREIAAGRLDQRLDVQTGDEIETLAASFNSMAGSLAATRNELVAAVAAEQKRATEVEEAYEALKATQLQLAHAEKMGLLGQLAGGIAHDFNNLLGGILGCADLLRRRGGDKQRREHYVELILETGRRAADLVRQLLSFARPGPTTRVAVDIHDLIEEVVRILRHTIDPRIRIIQRLHAERAVVEGDASELQSALLNLGVNARDAMPERGRLRFSTTVVHLDEELCRGLSDPVEPGPYLEVAVSDTGVGIEKQVLARIFEPFFTTKEIGKGTGLGLAAVYGTVLGHDGTINVYSEPGQGTVFKIYLPLAADDAMPAPAPSPEVVSGSGRILLVDDEPVIRALAADMLHSMGYEVVLADSGEQALDLYDSTIDLAIVDMVMPGMSGGRLLRELQKLDPAVKVVIASGFHLEADRTRGAVGYLNKPFLMATLSQTVSAALRTELKLLIADDSAVSREVIEGLARELGHETTVVGDGADALEAVKRGGFDLVLLDVELPRMSGIEATAAIRALGDAIPIIAMTGHGSAADEQRCNNAGMDGFLPKPVTLDALRQAIADTVRRSRPARQDPPRRENEGLARRIAAAFVEETPALLDALRDAIARDDAKALHHAAHTLYGSLLHFDAAHAAELADRLQGKGQKGDLDATKPLAAELAEECNRLLRELKG